jgi:hypothetical protein
MGGIPSVLTSSVPDCSATCATCDGVYAGNGVSSAAKTAGCISTESAYDGRGKAVSAGGNAVYGGRPGFALLDSSIVSNNINKNHYISIFV